MDGYSMEEIEKRTKVLETTSISIVNYEIRLGEYALDAPDPTCRAFYILLSKHPNGILKKDLNALYKEEFLSILKAIPRERAQSKKKNNISLNDQASLYKCKINKAIEDIENEHGGINLSSCKIGGGYNKPYYIYGLFMENLFLKGF